jgi:hypothetical protein
MGGLYMMGRKDGFQSKVEFIDLNVLVPKNHTILF